MAMQLVERWEGRGKGALYQIDVERMVTSPGREFFNIRLSRNRKSYENTLARSPDAARERVQHAVDWGLAFGTAIYRRTYPDAKVAPYLPAGELKNSGTSNPHELAAKLAMFLTTRVGNRTGKWEGTMCAEEQRALFGRFFGGGTVLIDGAAERIGHRVSRCSGLDYEYTADIRWSEL